MVDAATFKDGNRTYTIEELLIDCPSAIDYSHIDEKNNFLFSNSDTGDNILSIIILGGFSLIILTGALIYFKKSKTITK